jgi:hypothetical protein
MNKYYTIITYNDNFLCFVDKNSSTDGHIGFTRVIEAASVCNFKFERWYYLKFIKKLENTFRDYDELLAHPNTVIMKGKTYEDIRYFKDRVTLFNISIFFEGYDTKKLRVEYNISNANLRKWKIKKLFDE